MSTAANPDVFGWRWGGDDVDVNSQTFLAGNNVSFEIPQADLDSTFFYLRTGIENDGDMSASGDYRLQVEDPGNPGTWDDIDSSSSFVQIAGSGTAEADQTTVTTHDITGGAGTDVNGLFNNGNLINSLLIGTNLGGGNNFDLVWAMKFIGADLPGSETLNFRVTSDSNPITDDTSGMQCTIEAGGPDELSAQGMVVTH